MANIGVSVDELDSPKDGVVVVRVCALVGDEYVEATGSSKTDPRDKFNPQIGYELAAGRALREIGRRLLASGNNKVNALDKEREKRESASAEALAAKRLRRYGIDGHRPFDLSRPTHPWTAGFSIPSAVGRLTDLELNQIAKEHLT